MNRQLRLMRNDSGVTLIEMMVAVTILGTILTIVTQGLIVAQRTMTDNSSRLDGLSQTNVAVEGMTRVLRTAILPSQVQATCSRARSPHSSPATLRPCSSTRTWTTTESYRHPGPLTGPPPS